MSSMAVHGCVPVLLKDTPVISQDAIELVYTLQTNCMVGSLPKVWTAFNIPASLKGLQYSPCHCESSEMWIIRSVYVQADFHKTWKVKHYILVNSGITVGPHHPAVIKPRASLKFQRKLGGVPRVLEQWSRYSKVLACVLSLEVWSHTR